MGFLSTLIGKNKSRDDEPQASAAGSPGQLSLVEESASKNKESNRKNKPRNAREDFSKPPSLVVPKITTWILFWEKGLVCQSGTTNCKRLPKDNFFCVTWKDFDIHEKATQIISEAGKTCKKWGEDRMSRQLRGESPAIPERPSDLKSAVDAEVTFQASKHLHVSLLSNHSGTDEMICYSKKDREKISDFVGLIMRRCEEWPN